jgi:alpha-N-arabinofuranosidase
MKPLVPFFLLVTLFEASGDPIQIRLQAEKTGAPISKYIYGQFIEHLGRCIYGGLWAEMLEDRKFYFIVTDRYRPWGTAEDSYWGSGPYDYLRASPWKVVGPAGAVSMDTDNPFAGIHSPAVRLPDDGSAAGISQEGLALEKGKAYSGRIVLSGNPGVSVRVRLVTDSGEAIENAIIQPGASFTTFPLSFVAPSTSDNARIEVLGKGSGSFEIGAVSLMPSDNLEGWRPDVISLLKELNSPIYRWPGGNFVSGYDWRDGIGDRDRRPPRQNPAWKGVEPNDVGIHEYMRLMAMIGAEPYVALNTGLGTVKEVVDEVEYFNGAADTPMGKLRAANGRPEPFRVGWWAVGNEMYGEWQLGHMPIEDYVKKHNSIVDAIRKVDPGSHVVGVGSVGKWDETILKESAARMDLISEHIYRKEIADVDAHSRQLADDIERIAQAHQQYRRSIPELSGRDIRIAMDEWNYWYGRYVYGELGVQYHLKDALGIARAFHAFFRNSGLYFMANYAQTVNVIGAIKTNRTAAAFDTTGLALKLYRNSFGSIPVEVSGQSGRLDVSAAFTEDRKTLTLAIVNTEGSPQRLTVDFGSVRLSGKGTKSTITGPSPMASNEPGKPPNVVLKNEAFKGDDSRFDLPPLSISIYRLELKQ